MHNSSPIPPRLLLPLIVMAATAAGSCRQQPDTADRNPVENAVANLPSVPRPSPPLDRAALLAAVAQAASATAAGAELPADLRALAGRRFEMRIRFGCRGPSNETDNGWLRWSFDPQSRRVRLYARPTISKDEPLVARLPGEQEFEAVEGFWIPRPWLLQPVCPAAAAIETVVDRPEPDPEQDQASPRPERPDAPGDDQPEEPGDPVPRWPRIGIVQFFTSTDSRTGRRDDRAYEAAHALNEGQAIGSQGFNLVLSGRLRSVPGRRVIECVASNADSPPECIVSAEFQRVWIEQPETGEVIAQWGGG